mgnify:FL=1
MLKFIEEEKIKVEKFLNDNMEHQDKKIDYILYKPDKMETNILASNSNDEAIEFRSNTNDFNYVPEWDYNFDYYIYNLLEENWKIEYMTPEVHYSIWNSINELYPNDIDYKDGVQNYLQYCADNKITKKYLDEETGLNTPDVMKHFEGIALNETMKYKGYIIEAGDLNDDNPKENLVYIYDNEQDYINGDEIETISLNTIGLKQNVRDYIDEFYIDKTVIESEKAYFTFVLGYDLLNDMLKKSSTPENDISYDFCNMVAEEFLKSEEYKNVKYSSYEMLESWVNDNKNFIKNQHDLFVGESSSNKTRKLGNGMYLIDVGYRKEQPVALVKKETDYGLEYIVAFNYKIDNDRINWAYGSYYGDDFTKAKQDFDKVLNGGNLSKTFERNDER